VRALALALFVTACHASATVQNTMPVANMQFYRSVAVRVRSNVMGYQGFGQFLEQSVNTNLRQKCGFESVGGANDKAELVLDLTITKAGKDSGFITIQNQTVMEALLVLSDGQNGDLLGTAKISGNSAAMTTSGSNPDQEAVEVVGKAVADLLAKSGCTGPRIARAEPPKLEAPTPGVDERHRGEAEKLNEDGKNQMFGAHMPEALALFQQANQLLPDARYQFNVCLALGVMEKWNDAIGACNKAKSMNAKPELVAKIDRRLEALQKHQ